MYGHHYSAHSSFASLASWLSMIFVNEKSVLDFFLCRFQSNLLHFPIMLLMLLMWTLNTKVLLLHKFEQNELSLHFTFTIQDLSSRCQSKWKFVQMLSICLDAGSLTSEKMNCQHLTAFRYVFISIWENRDNALMENENQRLREKIIKRHRDKTQIIFKLKPQDLFPASSL